MLISALLSALLVAAFLSGLALGDRWPLSDYPMFAEYRRDPPLVYRVAMIDEAGELGWWEPAFVKEKKLISVVLQRGLSDADSAKAEALIRGVLRQHVLQRRLELEGPAAWAGIAGLRLIRRGVREGVGGELEIVDESLAEYELAALMSEGESESEGEGESEGTPLGLAYNEAVSGGRIHA